MEIKSGTNPVATVFSATSDARKYVALYGTSLEGVQGDTDVSKNNVRRVMIRCEGVTTLTTAQGISYVPVSIHTVVQVHKDVFTSVNLDNAGSSQTIKRLLERHIAMLAGGYRCSAKAQIEAPVFRGLFGLLPLQNDDSLGGTAGLEV